MKEFEQWLRSRAQALLRERGERFDVVRMLAEPLPVQAMAHLLGLPFDDWRRLFGWSESAMRVIGGLVPVDALAPLFQDLVALQTYLAHHVEPGDSILEPTPSTDPRDQDEDVIHLLSYAVATGTIETWEASGLLFQLVVAGSDTTVGLIGAAIRRLAEDPRRWFGSPAGPSDDRPVHRRDVAPRRSRDRELPANDARDGARGPPDSGGGDPHAAMGLRQPGCERVRRSRRIRSRSAQSEEPPRLRPWDPLLLGGIPGAPRGSSRDRSDPRFGGFDHVGLRSERPAHRPQLVHPEARSTAHSLEIAKETMMLSGEKILITGASGVVGLPIASELAKSKTPPKK